MRLTALLNVLDLDGRVYEWNLPQFSSNHHKFSELPYSFGLNARKIHAHGQRHWYTPMGFTACLYCFLISFLSIILSNLF
jgi:hypothetical protein